ncbi:MAG TPA: VWA domain-containing protein [Opitutaceae bacterium]|nr:VWA domain-containing protein [Opitutaceae bacterium]
MPPSLLRLLVGLALLIPFRAVAAPSADTAPATLIVLDASGSMRERIGGETKMALAQRAVRELVEGLPPGATLGLVAYSHRRNECNDLELLVPPGPLDKTAFLKAVDGLKPRGPTPLSAALRFAAEKLEAANRRATIILVSDGLETCGGDPCLTANELARLGPGLTIHAVGFDLTAKEARGFACIATATGGRFLQANDAASLKDALGLAVAEATASAAPPAEVLTAATLKVPPQVTAGAAFPVEWTGPDNAGDYVTIVARGAPDDAYESSAYTKQGTPVTLTALIDPGAAEVRYVAARSRTVLARAPVEIRPAEVTLAAPDKVTAGASVPIEWKGPANAGDYLTIVPPKAPDGEYAGYDAARAGTVANVTAPIAAGEAEIRYMSGQGRRVLARRAIAVVAAEVTLAAPEEIEAGAVVPIEWTGPGNAGDYLTIVPRTAPDGKYENYDAARAGHAARVTAPIEPGECEVRYVTGQGAKVLARRPIRIVAAAITLNAPEEAKAGGVVAIEWTGPGNSGDYLTIVPVSAADGKYANYDSARKGQPAHVTAPLEPGECEIRYMTGQGAKVLARRPIRIVATPIALVAPGRVAPGAAVAIEWTGPDNAGDYLTIVPAEAPAGTYAAYAYTRAGSPARVAAPAKAGACEVRYISGQGAKTLASRAIVVEAP